MTAVINRGESVLIKYFCTILSSWILVCTPVAAQTQNPAGGNPPQAEVADQPMDPGFATRARDLDLKSSSVLVVDQSGNRTIYAKNARTVVPIASITKLMTAMVALDSKLELEDRITITTADIDDVKGTSSRLRVGTTLTRDELLLLALMSSENRAAAALSRAYPGGVKAFVTMMNRKAAVLGMPNTRFVDATGLSSENVSTAQDLAKMVSAAFRYPVVRDYTTHSSYAVKLASGRILQYNNSNGLIKSQDWNIGLSKTGYISEAGRCLVMQTVIASTPMVIILLDSWGKYSRIGDANRIRKWIESNVLRQPSG